jgi:hypothetical protein
MDVPQLQFCISLAQCVRLDAMCFYNHDFYGLPFKINECQVLHDSYDGGEVWNGYSIGVIVNGKYEPRYWLHADMDNNHVCFDSSFIKDYNQWT